MAYYSSIQRNVNMPDCDYSAEVPKPKTTPNKTHFEDADGCEARPECIDRKLGPFWFTGNGTADGCKWFLT